MGLRLAQALSHQAGVTAERTRGCGSQCVPVQWDEGDGAGRALLAPTQRLCGGLAPCGTQALNAGARAQGVTAFLERSNYAKAVRAPGAAPRPGALLEVVVTAARDRRMVHVSADARAAAAAVAREWDGLTLGALAPGARARAPARVVRLCRAWVGLG